MGSKPVGFDPFGRTRETTEILVLIGDKMRLVIVMCNLKRSIINADTFWLATHKPNLNPTPKTVQTNFHTLRDSGRDRNAPNLSLKRYRTEPRNPLGSLYIFLPST